MIGAKAHVMLLGAGVIQAKREYYLQGCLVLPQHLQFDRQIFITALKGFFQGQNAEQVDDEDHTSPFLRTWHKNDIDVGCWHKDDVGCWHKNDTEQSQSDGHFLLWVSCGCSEYNIEAMRRRLAELEHGESNLDSIYSALLEQKEQTTDNPLCDEDGNLKLDDDKQSGGSPDRPCCPRVGGVGCDETKEKPSAGILPDDTIRFAPDTGFDEVWNHDLVWAGIW